MRGLIGVLLAMFSSYAMSQAFETTAQKKRTDPANSNTTQKTGSKQEKINFPAQLPPPSDTTLKLIAALQNNNLEIAELLLQSGGDINCKNCSNYVVGAVMTVPTNGLQPNKRLVWMVEHGADINAQADDGRTPIMFALDRGLNVFWSHVPDVTYFMKKDADVKLKDKLGKNALHHFAEHYKPSPPQSTLADAELIRRENIFYAGTFQNLMVNGIDINDVDLQGNTASHYAARNCNELSVDLFIKAGSDLRKQNLRNETSLDIAIDTAIRNPSPSCNKVVTILKSS